MLLKLAWRNIWRNKRRSIITMAMVIMAVVLAVFMRSIQQGMYGQMIENMAGVYTGYLQLHQHGYQERQSLANGFRANDTLHKQILSHPNIKGAVPRLESMALASKGKKTKAALIVGIDPVQEHRVTNLKNKLLNGEYLAANGKGVLVGAGLAERLQVNIGDNISLVSRAITGLPAQLVTPVVGIVQFGNPELSDRMVYLPLRQAQDFFDAKGRLTAYVLLPADHSPDALEKTADEIAASVGKDYEVLSWEEMLPGLKQAIAADSAGGIVTLGVLYVVIGFGIFGTILMMTREREYEFGVLTAIGMKRWQLSAAVVLEVWLLVMTATFVGMLLAVPVVYYFNINPLQFTGDMAITLETYGMEPIMPTSLNPAIFYNQALIVLGVASLLALFPIRTISRLKPVEAMRH